jgi:hypothetical protein
MNIRVSFVSISSVGWLLLLVSNQYLATISGTEQALQEERSPNLADCTHVEWEAFAQHPLLILSCAQPPVTLRDIEKHRERLDDISCDRDPECLWSKRFFKANLRLEIAQSHQKTLQRWLFEVRVGGCGDSSYDWFYFDYLNRQVERNREEISSAEQAKEQLLEQLRKSAQPAGWARSQLALQPLPSGKGSYQRQSPTKAFWLQQLSKVDQQYQKVLSLLQAELFRLVYRRPANPGEDITVKGGLGICVPSCVFEIDKGIKELLRDSERDKAALVEEAIHEGALPGWFR